MRESKYHLNTIYIGPEKRMEQLPYEQLKSQLNRENYFNPLYVEKNPLNNNNMNSEEELEDTMSELKKLMIDESSDISTIDKKKLAQIHSIKLQPIVNENFISSFDEHEYKLEPEDKVKIVKEKVFRVQNYYNYLYELKCKEEHERKNSQIQNYLKLAKDNNKDSIIETNLNNKLIKEKSIINRDTESNIINRESMKRKNESYNHNNNSREENEGVLLDPAYTKYEESRRRESQCYFLKEKDRKKVEESSTYPNQQQQRSSYNNYNDRYHDDRW